MASLFGFTITRDNKDAELRDQSFVTPSVDDGATTVQAGGYYGTYLDMDAAAKSESDIISRYREISLYPDCDTAIEEIVSQSVAGVDDEDPITLNLDGVELPDRIKKMIRDEFSTILSLLDFNQKAHDIFRRWYIDGRLYYQKVIESASPQKGIRELRYIDPRKIRKVREVKKTKTQAGIDVVESIDDFFIYNEKGLTYTAGVTSQQQNVGIKISPDTIAFCPSGLLDLDKNIVLGYLHKAIKTVNQLKMMEDSLVIYRLSRAPERRIFYIDVGNLPKQKAEQYLKDIMARYRNKIVYDSNTGEIKDDRKFMTMLEDFWLPRREGGRGTEITTLPGGENLGQIDDVRFFQGKLYQSLNVPASRMQQDQGLNFGRQAEISRDELKFAKFIDRLRKKFNVLFDELLHTQLVLKSVITEADWKILKESIKYNYAQDQFFEEMKDAENMRNRIDLVNQMTPYIGTYFSKQYIRRKILRLSDEEIEMLDDQMQDEVEVTPEATPGQPMGEQPTQDQPSGSSGQPTVDQQAMALGNAMRQ